MSVRLPAAGTTRADRVQRRAGAAARRAGARVAAYRTVWREHGADPASVRSADDLARLPVIAKHDLLRFTLTERCAEAPAAGGLRIERTGGSTGQPFDVPVARADRRRRQLRFLRALLHCGYRPGQRLLMLTAHGGGGALARLLNWRYLPITLSERALAEACLAFRPAVLYGPLNPLLGLARGLDALGARLPRPRAVISTAEQLDPLSRRRLHEAFGVEPADFYGMTETGLLAWRAGGHDRYRLAESDFLFEFLPCTDDPSLERLVVTGLQDAAMPLVRFDTGDLVRRDTSGPGRPVVEFTGRQVDSLLMPDGERISPYRITLALEEITGLQRFRVVQQPDMSLQAEGWAADAPGDDVLEQLRACLLELTGRRVPVHVQAGAGTCTTPERKFRPIRSTIGAER